jgi:hypothetical protein
MNTKHLSGAALEKALAAKLEELLRGWHVSEQRSWFGQLCFRHRRRFHRAVKYVN